MTEPAQMVREVADSDTIPNSQFYFPPTIKPKPSTVTPSATRSGVYSHNPILEHNTTELWRYLLSNLRPPQMVLRVDGISGYGDGYDTEDFSLSIDVSNEVIPQWSRIVTRWPDDCIRQTLEKYTSSSYPFKEFRLKKVVVWDKDRVTRLIRDVVKEAEYGTDPLEGVFVKFRMSDDEVVTSGSNWISRAAHNKHVRCLCWATCLCALFCPAWHLARDRKKYRLECEYRMAVSADDFVSRNSGLISSGCRRGMLQATPFLAL